MSLINITDLTFCYDGGFDNIFENVSFMIDTNWKLGLTGRNGRGKTTFLNLLLGKFEHKGNISSSVDFDYFPFEISDKGKNTIDVLEEVASDAELWKINRELSLLCVSEDVLYRPFETLSNGEQTKVMLAALFLKENNFLLIDEPTNHLDMEARKIVSEYLNAKKGFILVSHDRAFLDNCIDHILSINRANIEIQKGNFSSWQQNKELKDSYELAENEKLEKEISALSSAAKRTSAWSDKVERTKKGTLNSGVKPDKGYIGHKAAKMMKRSKAIEERRNRAAEEKTKLLKNIEVTESLAVSSLEYFKNALIEAKDLSIFYGDKEVVKKISFTINNGDRIAITGKNGSGKSSILKLLAGEGISFSGGLSIGSGLIISYIPQNAVFTDEDLKEYASRENIDEPLFKAILRKLDFSRTQFEKSILYFSEGQKRKVLLAKSLCQRAHLYIWDEPLNFIDVISRIQIENLIVKHKPTMIFVEHDNAFCDSVATKRILL